MASYRYKRFSDLLSDPEAGTIRHFFEAVYLPNRTLSQETIARIRRLFGTMFEHYGRDLRLEEQTDELAADHLAWLAAHGLGQKTIQGRYRHPWFAVWRAAHKMGLVANPPRRFKTQSGEEDDGSVEELKQFFYRIFWPRWQKKPQCKAMIRTHKLAEHLRSYMRTIHAFSRFLGHEAQLSDLNLNTVTGWLESRMRQDVSRERMLNHVRNIKTVWRVAYQTKHVEAFELGFDLDRMYDALKRKDLFVFFTDVFRPDNIDADDTQTVLSYSRSIRSFSHHLGRFALLSDLTEEQVTAWLTSRYGKKSTRAAAKRHQKNIGAIWTYAADKGLIADSVTSVLDPHGIWQPKKPGGPKLPELPDPEPGTVRHFFETVYRPQRLIGCSASGLVKARTCIRFLHDHYGRDIRLEEQTDELAADHLEWALKKGILPITVNTAYRSTWFAVWRLAYEKHLVDRLPTVRKLRVHQNEPDSWHVLEVNRLVEATNELQVYGRDKIAGIPLALYWEAIFRVQWWTALRRKTLLQLRRADIDLDKALLTVPATFMKNKRGKKFCLGPDAIEILKRIWQPERVLLFPWPFTLTTFHKDFRRLKRLAGLEGDVTGRGQMKQMHKMRRSIATEVAVHKGVYAACELLGHSATDVTMRYLDPSRMPEADVTDCLQPLKSFSLDAPPNGQPQDAIRD